MKTNFQKVFGSGKHGKNGNSYFTMPEAPNGKRRKFAGSSRNFGFGPILPAGVILGMGGGSDTVNTSSGDSSGAGDGGGGGMGESDTRFAAFLESLRTEDNAEVLDAIMEGYSAMMESN